jgi:O-antigen/teichoic acid export membrane protein
VAEAAEPAGPRPTTVEVSRRRLTLATGIQLGGRLLGAVLGIFVAATLARSLSRPQFGELSLALTMLALAGSIGDLGISQVAIREIARRPDERAGITGALWSAQLTMGVVTGLAGVAIGFALMHGAQARLMDVLVMATMPIGSVGALTVAAQARLRPELTIVPMLVQNVVWLAAVAVLGGTSAGLALYGLCFLGAGVLQSAVTLALRGRITEVSFRGARALILKLLRISWPIGVAGMFVTAYYRIDGVLLFHYRGATQNAYYSAGYRVIDVLQILPGTVSGVLLPLLASAERDGAGAARVRQLFGLTAAMLLVVVLPVAVCGSIVSPAIVRLLYGAHYHASAPLLRVLLPAFIPISLGYLLTSQLILHDLLRPYIAITFIGAVANVVANAVAIPRYGAAAAAWATLGTELIVMAAIAFVVRMRLHLSLPWLRILRCAGAVAVTCIPVWLLRSQSVLLTVPVAVVVYAPVVFLARAVTLDEVRSLLTKRAVASA